MLKHLYSQGFSTGNDRFPLWDARLDVEGKIFAIIRWYDTLGNAQDFPYLFEVYFFTIFTINHLTILAW